MRRGTDKCERPRNINKFIENVRLEGLLETLNEQIMAAGDALPMATIYKYRSGQGVTADKKGGI